MWIQTGKKVTKGLILLLILYVLGGLLLPPLFHKKVQEKSAEVFMSQVMSQEPGQERVLSIEDNREALIWRLRAMDLAEEEIILATFDMSSGNSGKDIFSSLLAAAERGVKVRILVDGLNGLLKLQNDVYWNVLLAEENVEARFYNPLQLTLPWKLNYRMHDKYLIVDEKLYLLGGRNTNDLFLGDYREHYNVDRDILVYEEQKKGMSLIQLQEYFEKIWQLPECEVQMVDQDMDKIRNAREELLQRYEELPENIPELKESYDLREETWPADSIVLLSNPMEAVNKEPVLWEALGSVIETGEDILIQTPYIICGKEMYRDLEQWAEGRTLQIMTNAVENGANPWGCTDYLNEKEKILGMGIPVYEYLSGQSFHTKTVLVDEHISLVGSFNMDMRSAYLDTEMMLMIECPELNQHLREHAKLAMEDCKLVQIDGSEVPGRKYEEKPLETGEKIFYGVLRRVIGLFRHLL